MANAFVLFGGIVKQTTGVSNYTFHNKSGFVATLTFGGVKYTHTFTLTNSGTTITAGYYQEIPFLKWLVAKTASTDLAPYLLDTTKLVDAIKGDTIIVSQLLTITPYAAFCYINQYSWSYDPNVDILDSNLNIAIPVGTQPSILSVTIVDSARDFYFGNINLINSPDFTDNKDDAAYSLAICALYINRINLDIFPLFNTIPELANYITVQNSYWSDGTIFTQPTYEDILQYEESLVNYYNAAYNNQYYITTLTDSNKLIWLASVLSASGLAVFPLDTKVALLNQLLDVMSQAKITSVSSAVVGVASVTITNPYAKIAALGPELILNITASIVDVPTQTDSFLNSLLNIKYTNTFTADQTLYEALYDNLSDNNIGVLTLGAINTNDNRKQFVQSIYSVWKSTKYYPYYNSPDYTEPANPSTGVFQQSFFITNKTQYYDQVTAPATITYRSSAATLSSYQVNFSYDFQAETIIANEIDTEAINDEHGSSSSTSTIYGTYQLFQPVTLVGYTQNNVVHLPKTSCVPLFYLKYAYDAKAINDFEIGLLDFLELTFNLTLNLTGAGEITDLSYLSEISELSEVTGMADDTPVLNWENFLGLNRTVMITAGSLNAISQYLVQQAGNSDPNVQAFVKTLTEFLGIIALGTMAIDGTAQIISAAKAQEILEESANLAEEDQLTSKATDELEEFVGNISELVDLMNTKLSQLPNIPPGAGNTIITKFATITDSQEQLNFFNDFYFVDDDDPLWVKLNEVYDTQSGRTLVDDWKEISFRQEMRSDINFLTNYRFISKDNDFIVHVFEGELNEAGNAVGIHSIEAINDGTAQINQILNPPNASGYYKAKVSFISNGTATAKKGFSTFFPDTWIKQRVIEEVTLSFTNKIQVNGAVWAGKMSDGNQCRIIITAGSTAIFDETTKMITAYPYIIF